MRFNRDVSVLLLNALHDLDGLKNIQIADIMAGSGVRSLRFLLELEHGIIKNMTVNDYDAGFARLFEKNLKLNKIKPVAKIHISSIDANKLLLESSGFDYIDIDPFGSPNPFLEAAVVRISRDGILAVTATDTAPLSGTYPDACQRKYWAKPLRNHLMHEVGLRILIRKVQLIGMQHEKALIPIYSYFKDHYFRIFFRCIKSKKECDKILAQHKYLLYCDRCMNYKIAEYNGQECTCSQKMEYAGPLFAGRLFDEKLAEKISKDNTEKSNKNFLETISEESHSEIIGFYDIHALAKKYKLAVPGFGKITDAIKKQGYSVYKTHFTPLGIKTDMPAEELVRIMKNVKEK
jgi:tRNA (guanine26-N2/guanine27-N2)-dimethyltransferase